MNKLRFIAIVSLLFLSIFSCDDKDNPVVEYNQVDWTEQPVTLGSVSGINGNLEEEMRIFNTEYVANGNKAIWPTTEDYEEPTKPGYMFVGWDFDWRNTPITQNTDIHAIWMKKCIPPVDNYGSEHPLDGPDDQGFSADGDTTTDGVRCNMETLEVTSLSDWITVTKIMTPNGNFKGALRYDMAVNTNTESRTGVVRINTPGTEIADPDIWGNIGADGVSTFCSQIEVYIIQRGASETPVVDESFDSLITAFRQYVTIPENGTTYNYLKEVYDEAEKQFDSGNSNNGLPNLYKQSNFPYIYNYYGSAVDEEKAFKSMTGWLFAMVLSELKPKSRNDFYKLGYEYGGYNKDSNIYGYTFHSDPNVARLVASAIYSTMRAVKNPSISTMRNEIGGSSFSNTLEYYSETEERYNVGTNDFFINLRNFMPTAPGPYLSDYSDRSSIGGYPYPNESKNSDYNLTMDKNIYDYIIENYNLNSTDNEKYQRTVQAIADKEWHGNHLFGTSKTVNGYTFNPVFGSDILGRTVTPNETLNYFMYYVANIGSKARSILQNDAYYGRIRPGQGNYDATKKSTTDDRLNVLVNFDIEDNDGRQTGYYNSDGIWVYPDIVASKSQYEEYMKKELWANSYPSGHSAGIWNEALILMEMFPYQADKIIMAATKYAVNRTIARFHWNSDTVNGRVLGSAICPVMHASSDFDSSFNAAKP